MEQYNLSSQQRGRGGKKMEANKKRRPTSSSVVAAATVLVSTAVCCCADYSWHLFAAAHDHMGMHSIFPPILQNYWENGLNYWSFGSETVITDDIIRLTQSGSAAASSASSSSSSSDGGGIFNLNGVAANIMATINGNKRLATYKQSKGYLWNRHGNHLESWTMNVTLQLDNIRIDESMDNYLANKKTFDLREDGRRKNERGGGGDGDSQKKKKRRESLMIPRSMTGVGVWFQTETPRHGDRSFFGAPNRFNGLAITMDHNFVISVFVNDGYSAIEDVERDRKGSCRASTRTVTLYATYLKHEKTLVVGYYPEDKFYDQSSLIDREDRERQAAEGPERRRRMHETGHQICAKLSNISLVTHSYFGITAANTPYSQARVEVKQMFVSPADGGEDAEEERVGLHVFDGILDVQERRLSIGKEDNPFNFPPKGGQNLKTKKMKKIMEDDEVGVVDNLNGGIEANNVNGDGNNAAINLPSLSPQEKALQNELDASHERRVQEQLAKREQAFEDRMN